MAQAPATSVSGQDINFARALVATGAAGGISVELRARQIGLDLGGGPDLGPDDEDGCDPDDEDCDDDDDGDGEIDDGPGPFDDGPLEDGPGLGIAIGI